MQYFLPNCESRDLNPKPVLWYHVKFHAPTSRTKSPEWWKEGGQFKYSFNIYYAIIWLNKVACAYTLSCDIRGDSPKCMSAPIPPWWPWFVICWLLLHYSGLAPIALRYCVCKAKITLWYSWRFLLLLWRAQSHIHYNKIALSNFHIFSGPIMMKFWPLPLLWSMVCW
jgi:hypothetical protein